MNRVNPAYIPRNHLVEEALTRPPPGPGGVPPLLDAVSGRTRSGPAWSGTPSRAVGCAPHVTYCGT
jgi:hypothetical protein